MQRTYLFLIMTFFVFILSVPVVGAENNPPIADAGQDMDVFEGEPVVLDGSGSSDPDGFIPIFNWTQKEGPVVTLNNSFGATAYFDAPLVETDTKLVFELLVIDNETATDRDTIEITVKVFIQGEQPPIANAGMDIKVSEKEQVVLDGSDSADPDGTIEQYEWRQIDGPSVTINNSDTAVANFNAPSADKDTILIFELNIKDNNGLTDSDHIVVTVKSLSENGDDFTYKAVDKITLGPKPEGVTATLKNAYFIDSINNDILIVDIDNLSIIGTIVLDLKPYGIAATPDGNHLYIGHNESLSIMRTSDNQVINNILLPERVSIITISPDGNYAYAGDDVSSFLYVIRTWDQKLIKVVQLNGRTGGIAATSEYIYVTDFFNNRVQMISTTDYRIIRSVPVGEGPKGLAVTPDGQYLYVAISSGNSVSVIRTIDIVVIKNFFTGTNPVEVGVSPEGDTVFVTNSEGDNVSLISTLSNAVTNNISVGKRPTQLAVMPNGNYVFVINRDDKTASVIQKTVAGGDDDDDSCFISSLSE